MTYLCPGMFQYQRYFNTSVPNIPEEHYTLMRPDLVRRGQEMVGRSRYFTIWAPRQTGKSTYFLLLETALRQEGYEVMHINLENFKEEQSAVLMTYLRSEAKKQWNIPLKAEGFGELFNEIKACTGKNLVFIIDEVEGLNPDLFGQFLHTLRNLYHSRTTHCLKSVILVGVSNIVGVVVVACRQKMAFYDH